MNKILKNIIDFYLPLNDFGKENDFQKLVQKRKARLVVLFAMIACFFSFLMFTVRFGLEGIESKTILILPLTSFFMLILPLIIKYFNKVGFVLNAMVAIFALVVFYRTLSTGGITSPVLLWFSPLPFIAATYSKRDGIIWTFVSIMLVIVILYANKMGIFVNKMEARPIVNAFVIIILILGVGFLSFFYENQRESNEKLIRKSEKELAKTKKMASLGSLSGGIAHEINNPLTIVKGRVNILLKLNESGQLDQKKLKEGLKKVNSNIMRIHTIIDALKTFTREDYMTEFKDIVIVDVIQKSLDLCSVVKKFSKIEIINNITNENLVIKGNFSLVERVFLNLFNNAYDEIKTLNQPWIKIEHVQKENPNFIVLAITDSGKAFTTELAEQVMDPFFTTKKIGEGTGLGLNLCEKILDMHQGFFKINIEARHAQFLVSFPKEIS